MRAIIKVLTSRWFLLSIAFLMLVLVIWWGGPYLALGDVKPLESIGQRLLGVLWLAVLFILAEVLRRFRVRRASNQLATQMSKQATPAHQPPAEAMQLRARFEEAIGALRATKGKAFNLYELPWYIIIGPPGVGKTTVIANSGLNFPLAKKFGAQALRGVGGTRNCDWWFTDEAVLLDTAGRYTTQDSDATSDQLGWTEFLTLLCKHRGRRPINGVMVAMSAPDLLSQSEAECNRHVQAVRDRLEELGRELKIDLPVYLFLTKLDLISGFTEFFDDLNQEHRAQVWGVTFPLEISRTAEGPSQLPNEFDLLLERLNGRLMQRMETERDVRRRALLFTFPRQFAALRRNLTDFVSATFGAEGAARKLQLRGVYFTSGTQEGTPIDRMIGALARTFGLNMRNVNIQQSQGRAYFIQRLLKEVLFKESGLAGVNRRMELRQGVLNIGVYVAVVLVLVIGLAGFTVSYRNNRNYLASLTPPVDQLETLSRNLDEREPLIAGLGRLDAYAKATAAAERYLGQVPMSMRWGLFQGRSLGNAARDAYQAQLNAVLLPAIADHFRNRLIELASEPDKLYEYLKAYLMLGQPQNRDPNLLLYIGDIEWQRVLGNDPATLERFNNHFNALIADADHMQPAKMDMDTVKGARISLAQTSLPALMYSRLKLGYVKDGRAVNIGQEMSLGGDAVFVRKSGASLEEPFPAVYTRGVFKEVANIGRAELVGQFVRESWVMGSNFADVGDAPLLTTRLMQLYEEDYIRAWDTLIGDLTLNTVSDPQLAAQQWGLLGAPTSPWKRLLELVRTNTALVDLTKKEEPGKAQQLLDRTLTTANRVLGNDTRPQPRPGEAITRHFESINKLLEGSPAPIEVTLQKFAAIHNVMSAAGGIAGPSSAQYAAQVAAAFRDLELHAKTLPPVLGSVVSRASGSGTSVVRTQLKGNFMGDYNKVINECRMLAQGRYPLLNNGVDMTLADFAKLFGPNGTYDTFFREQLQTLVDTSARGGWKWKPDAEAIGSRNIPLQFQRADAIRRIYFPSGSDPKVAFEVSIDSADELVQRATLSVDGQKYEFRNGPAEQRTSMVWPGRVGMAELSMTMPGFNPSEQTDGPWAMFKLFSNKTADFQPRGNKFVATFTLSAVSVRLLITPGSSLNPFGKDNPIKGFNCQG